MTTVLITNGRIITAVDDYRADILIEDGQIKMIGAGLAGVLSVGDDVEVHDAAGMLVMPGGVDVHTHLEATIGPAMTVDTFESGTKAAAFGGTTTLVDFAQQSDGGTVISGLENWQERARGACVDVGAHMIISDFNDQTMADMISLLKNDGVTSFKMFMAMPGIMMIDDGELLQIMRMTGENGALSCVHAENGLIIDQLIKEAVAEGRNEVLNHPRVHPPVTESEAVHRAIRIAELARSPLYLVHISAQESVQNIAEARDAGTPIYGETCPHYLFLTEEEYDRPNDEAAKYTMIPPLRSQEHQDALWRGLATDDLQIVATDHCPFCVTEQSWGLKHSKALGKESFAQMPNGAPGVETRLSLVYDGGVRTGRMSLNRYVQLMSTTPAKLFGLFPRKGTIAVGSDADIVLFDPEETWTIRADQHQSRVDYSLYEGREVTGRVKKVFLRGDMIVDGEDWKGRAGGGTYLRRGASGQV